MSTTERLTLIIKASTHVAAVEAAYRHGLVDRIPRPDPRASEPRQLKGGQVKLEVDATPSRISLAATWLCEEPHTPTPGVGYPEGSLLYYQSRTVEVTP